MGLPSAATDKAGAPSTGPDRVETAQPTAVVKAQPSSAQQLIQYFGNDTVRTKSALDISRGFDDSLKEIMLAMQEDANLSLTESAPRIAIAEKNLGRPLLMKIVCAVLKMLDYSLSLSFELTPLQVFEGAQLYLDKYRAESVQDLVLCIRLLKQGDLRDDRGGVLKVYNRLDAAVINEWMWAYANWKIDQLESVRSREKSSANGDTRDYVALLAGAMPDEIRKSLSTLPTRAQRTPDMNQPVPTHEKYINWLRDNADVVPFDALEEGESRAAQTGNEEVYHIAHVVLEKRRKSMNDESGS